MILAVIVGSWLWILRGGGLESLSLVREFNARPDKFEQALWTHLALAFGAVEAAHLVKRRVHRADDVRRCAAAARLVLHGARRLVRARPRRHLVVRHPVARLVAERPHDDARVVLVALHHTSEPRHKGRSPRRRLCQRALVARPPHEAVGLGVRLVDNVEADGVAQLVPALALRVVRGADGVDVVTLHQCRVRDGLRP